MILILNTTTEIIITPTLGQDDLTYTLSVPSIKENTENVSATGVVYDDWQSSGLLSKH